MHKFIEYISDLLFLHDCVIIPDFGGFICNYKSAYIDDESGLICPPSKDILFNRNLTHNDGLLVSWIAGKENISYEKATSQLMRDLGCAQSPQSAFILNLGLESLHVRMPRHVENGQAVAEFLEKHDKVEFVTDRRFNIIFEPGKHNFFAETLGMEPLPVVKVGLSDKIKPAVSGTSRSTQNPDIPKYINLESSGNILHRLLKYALGATAIAGIVIITQLDFFHTASDPNRDVNSSGVQPVIPAIQSSASGKITCNKVISPSQDYVDYDPVNDLKW